MPKDQSTTFYNDSIEKSDRSLVFWIIVQKEPDPAALTIQEEGEQGWKSIQTQQQ